MGSATAVEYEIEIGLVCQGTGICWRLRTMKYTPAFPSKPFESLDTARDWVYDFVHWYNEEHRHSGIQFVTPAQRHRGTERSILENRETVYQEARQRHPERWSQDTRNWAPEEEVWLNSENQDTKGAEIRDEAA